VSGDHAVVGQDSKSHFCLLCDPSACTEGSAKKALERAEGALRLPTLAIADLVLLTLHLASILRLWPLASAIGVSADGDDRRGDTEFFTTQCMVVFGVVSLVCEQEMNRLPFHCLPNARSKLRRVLTGTHTTMNRERQMTVDVVDAGQLRPLSHPVAFLLGAPDVVPAHVARLQACRVDGTSRRSVEPSFLPTEDHTCVEEKLPKPPFSNRRAA